MPGAAGAARSGAPERSYARCARHHLSKARAWEYNLKDGAWGVDELGFSQLPHDPAGAGVGRGHAAPVRAAIARSQATLDAIEAYAS